MEEEFQHGIELPELYELECFFECDVELAEPSEPWLHNHSVVFRKQHGDDQVLVMIAPMHSDARITWTKSGQEIVNLELSYVTQIRVARDEKQEQLRFGFFPATHLNPLRLQLRPVVKVDWSMELA